MSNLKDIHNLRCRFTFEYLLLYQDFNEQFEGYTQRILSMFLSGNCCFIRISMNNLKDIHNHASKHTLRLTVVLSGFQ